MKVERDAVMRVLAADGQLGKVTNEEIEAWTQHDYTWWELLVAIVTSPRYVWLGLREGWKVARTTGGGR